MHKIMHFLRRIHSIEYSAHEKTTPDSTSRLRWNTYHYVVPDETRKNLGVIPMFYHSGIRAILLDFLALLRYL